MILKNAASAGRKGAVWLAVALSFALTAYSLWLDRTASAAVAGAFMLALLLFKELPIVESLKVFTLEAKFTNRVNEADPSSRDALKARISELGARLQQSAEQFSADDIDASKAAIERTQELLNALKSATSEWQRSKGPLIVQAVLSYIVPLLIGAAALVLLAVDILDGLIPPARG